MNERKESLVATNGSDTVYPAKGHIVKIKFNNGKELDINKNDIVSTYRGEYMSQYSWAEYTHGRLEQSSNK